MPNINSRGLRRPPRTSLPLVPESLPSRPLELAARRRETVKEALLKLRSQKHTFRQRSLLKVPSSLPISSCLQSSPSTVPRSRNSRRHQTMRMARLISVKWHSLLLETTPIAFPRYLGILPASPMMRRLSRSLSMSTSTAKTALLPCLSLRFRRSPMRWMRLAAPRKRPWLL